MSDASKFISVSNDDFADFIIKFIYQSSVEWFQLYSQTKSIYRKQLASSLNLKEYY